MKLKPNTKYIKLDIEEENFGKNIENSIFESCVFTGCYFSDSLIHGANFKNCEFIGCFFRFSTLQCTKFYRCSFSAECNFVGANLSGSSFEGTDLEGCTMHSIQADNADFSNCNLRDADLSASCLHGANFKNSNMRYCDLSFSDCTQCNLTGATITYMDFEDTKLDNIKGAKILHLKVGPYNLYAYNPECIRVGCQMYPLEYWEKYAQQIARFHDALDEYTRYYPGTVKKLKEFYKEVQHETNGTPRGSS